jgi:hypothetical protein
MDGRPLKEQLHPDPLEQLRKYVAELINQSEMHVPNPRFGVNMSVHLAENSAERESVKNKI